MRISDWSSDVCSSDLACNFRCGYCMPADKVPDDYGMDAASRLSFDEIETLVRGFARLGMRKLRLTGGEPLLRKRLPELVARLAAVDGIDDLAVTTNAALLAKQARALRDAGRSEEHTYELQSLMRTSYAVVCMKNKSRKDNEP